MPVDQVLPNVRDGRKTVTTAGTAVALASSSTPCKKVTVQAFFKNTDVIVLGDSTVVAGDATDSGGTRRGVVLLPGATVVFDINDLTRLFMDAVVSGEGCSFVYQF